MEEKDFVTVVEDVETDIIESEPVTNSKKGIVVALAAGAVVLVGGLLYKKVVKPALAKRKAKKEQSEVLEVECEVLENDEN